MKVMAGGSTDVLLIERSKPYLKNYIANPYARPDNNVEERALKLVVIGRKNWLFVGNEGGGQVVIYCLPQTYRALKINPSLYFKDMLRRIPSL